MREGWTAKPLGELADIAYGYTEKAVSERIGPKFLRITDIQNDSVAWDLVPYCKVDTEDHSRYKLADGDLVFARTGATTGKSFLVSNPPDAVCASYLIRLRLRSLNMLPKFVSYFFNTAEYWDIVSKGTSGSAQGGFNASKLAAVCMPVPPFPEQQHIVAILDKAFAGLATATANAEKNLKNARELFDSTLSAILMEQACKQPKETLLSVCELIVDCEHKTAPTQPEGIASIRTPNIGKGELLLEGVNRVSEETFQIWSRRAVPQFGDLIFAREATAGNVAVIPPNLRCVLGQRTVLIRPKPSDVDSMYLAYLMLHPVLQTRLLAHSKGATVQHVNMKDIRALGLGSLPPLNTQRQTASKIAEIARRSKELEAFYQRKIRHLAALKESILQKAFAGELTLQFSKALVEAAE